LREGVAPPLVAPRVVRTQLDGAVVNREYFVDIIALAGTIAAEIGFGVFPARVRVALGFGDRLVVDRAVGFDVCRIAGPAGLGVEQKGISVQQQKTPVRTRVRRQLLELLLHELHPFGVPMIAAIIW
jgi:hypothetical protein